MRRAFGSCIGSIVAVPVEGAPGEMQRYVLEIDIAPRASVCDRMVFSFCNYEGRAVSYVRVGSSNIEKTEYDEKKKGAFEKHINERAEFREKEDLKEKKEALTKSIDDLKSKEDHLIGAAERKLLDNFRQIVREIDEEVKALEEEKKKVKHGEPRENREAVSKLLKFDIEDEMKSVAPINSPLETVKMIAARAWPSVTIEVPKDIGNIAETLSKQHEALER